jgi:hypothetical protein
VRSWTEQHGATHAGGAHGLREVYQTPTGGTCRMGGAGGHGQGYRGLPATPCEQCTRDGGQLHAAQPVLSVSLSLCSHTRAVLLGGFPRPQHSATLQPIRCFATAPSTHCCYINTVVRLGLLLQCQSSNHGAAASPTSLMACLQAGGGGEPCWLFLTLSFSTSSASVDNSTVVCQPSHTPQLSAPSVCVNQAPETNPKASAHSQHRHRIQPSSDSRV